MDFFTVPTVRYQVLYVLFIIHHARREIIHVGITPYPTAYWICQQLREAFPYDRDSKFSGEVVRALKGMGIKAVRIGYRTFPIT